jgi:hypothetical protein
LEVLAKPIFPVVQSGMSQTRLSLAQTDNVQEQPAPLESTTQGTPDGSAGRTNRGGRANHTQSHNTTNSTMHVMLHACMGTWKHEMSSDLDTPSPQQVLVDTRSSPGILSARLLLLPLLLHEWSLVQRFTTLLPIWIPGSHTPAATAAHTSCQPTILPKTLSRLGRQQ